MPIKEREGESMEEASEVKLHGMWGSNFVKRVELALKLKAVPYEYVEEDLCNKSQFLLQYNPVHKKVPVLLHNCRPIAETLVILEYIDEFWSNNTPPLLPEDPYKRAKVRFWANFFDQKVLPFSRPVIMSEGEEQEEAIKELQETLGVLEEGLAKDFKGKSPFFNGESLGLLGIIMGTTVCNNHAIKEATGVELMNPNKNPLLCAWISAVEDHPVVKEIRPPHDKLVERVKMLREKALQSTTAKSLI